MLINIDYRRDMIQAQGHCTTWTRIHLCKLLWMETRDIGCFGTMQKHRNVVASTNGHIACTNSHWNSHTLQTDSHPLLGMCSVVDDWHNLKLIYSYLKTVVAYNNWKLHKLLAHFLDSIKTFAKLSLIVEHL